MGDHTPTPTLQTFQEPVLYLAGVFCPSLFSPYSLNETPLLLNGLAYRDRTVSKFGLPHEYFWIMRFSCWDLDR